MSGGLEVRVQQGQDRWRARPVQAAVLRTFVTLAPVVAALATAAALAPLLPAARSLGERIGWWLVLCVVSTVPLLLTDRVLRRLLPLSSLLRLSMVFPDKAPSRFKVARQAAGVRNLQRMSEDARKAGLSTEPVRAAETVLTLISALSHHDPRTRGHSERVQLYVEMLAEELGIAEDERAKLRWAALVHDIGKIEVSAALLNKTGPPSGDEWEALKRHPIEGARFCIPLRDWLGEWALAIEQHHERWDGTGYPLGLAGTEISWAARIVAVADAYEAMTAARPYKKPVSAAAAREELARQAGAQFDPTVVRAFLNISLGRLQWTSGALAWMAQWPLVGQLPRLGEIVAVSSVTAAGATTLAVGGLIQPGEPSFAVWRDVPPTIVVEAAPSESPPVLREGAREVVAPPGLAVAGTEDGAGDELTVEKPPAHTDGWDQGGERRTMGRGQEQAAGRAVVAAAQEGDATPTAPVPDVPPARVTSPRLHPGNVPADVPGNVPTALPGSKPEENPGNKPEENPGNKPEESPGNAGGGKPEENPGNKPEENPGNAGGGKPDENPGNKPEENPGNKPPAPPGQQKG